MEALSLVPNAVLLSGRDGTDDVTVRSENDESSHLMDHIPRRVGIAGKGADGEIYRVAVDSNGNLQTG